MTSAGQRLSIISKSSIRYEGVLSKIDPTENTVSLISVRMHGTENRPVAEYIAPKNEVYDYIIFKGSDIKDLSVIPDKATQPPQDPAIVSAGKAVPQPKASGGGMGGMNANLRSALPGTAVSFGGSFGGSKPASSSYLQQSQPAASDYEQYNTSKPSAGGYAGDRSRYNTREVAREPAQYSGSKGYKGNRENGSKGDSYTKDYTKDYQATSYTPGYGGYGGHRSKGGDYGSKGDYSGKGDYSRDHSGKGGKMSSYSHYGDRDRGYQSHKGGYKGGKDSHKGGKGKGKGGKKGNAYASHTGMEFSSGEKAAATPATFKDDFDFEKMQEASQQEAKKHQSEAKAKPPAESKYQKEKGFFDSITYDANNREKVEKVEKHAQHDMDCATFGTKTVEDYERKTQSHFRKGGKKGDKGGKGGKGSKGGKSFKGGRSY